MNRRAFRFPEEGWVSKLASSYRRQPRAFRFQPPDETFSTGRARWAVDTVPLMRLLVYQARNKAQQRLVLWVVRPTG
jgi:hypothetical protein